METEKFQYYKKLVEEMPDFETSQTILVDDETTNSYIEKIIQIAENKKLPKYLKHNIFNATFFLFEAANLYGINGEMLYCKIKFTAEEILFYCNFMTTSTCNQDIENEIKNINALIFDYVKMVDYYKSKLREAKLCAGTPPFEISLSARRFDEQIQCKTEQIETDIYQVTWIVIQKTNWNIKSEKYNIYNEILKNNALYDYTLKKNDYDEIKNAIADCENIIKMLKLSEKTERKTFFTTGTLLHTILRYKIENNTVRLILNTIQENFFLIVECVANNHETYKLWKEIYKYRLFYNNKVRLKEYYKAVIRTQKLSQVSGVGNPIFHLFQLKDVELFMNCLEINENQCHVSLVAIIKEQ